MKKILIHVRNEDYEKMKPLLEGIYHIIIAQNEFVQVKAFVPDSDLNDAIESLREALDLRYKENLIEVTSPDFVISSTLSRAEKRIDKPPRTPVEELLDSAKDYSNLSLWSVALTSIAGLIALIGLFLNNVAIIIGAMLLSPILGPIHSFAIYAAVGKTKEAARSVGVLGALLVAVLVVSTIATVLIATILQLSTDPAVSLALTEEIIARTQSSPIYIFMALLLGFASILALSRDVPEAVAGVAIAAALLPPTAVAGIALVLLQEKAVNALIIVFDNAIGLIAGALAATLVLGITPRDGTEQRLAKQFVERTSILIIIALIILFASSVLIQ